MPDHNPRCSTVADEVPSTPNPFDVRTVQRLVALMSRHDLSEIDLSQGDRRIRLRRGSRVVAAPPTTLLPAAAPAPAAATATPSADKPSRVLVPITSPAVGTFYARPKPDQEPYVKVGSRVTPTTVVGQIEAMKLFSEIPAECTGVVLEIVAENGQPVEFGQVLFQVDPTA
jgi:acetyl-CoA carboxylase biotin carboxyl carrier protein